MATVSISDVRKSFGAHPVIHGVSVDIADGEFVTLVGPSGCGKSTLLRMIAGLEPVTGGAILVDGRNLNGVAPKDRDMALVFQNYALYPHMTVRQNMAFPLRIAKAPADQITASVARAAELLGLTPLLDRHPRQLSGGQRQRVAMGRAIVRNPRVFLFDEPLSNLDAKLRVTMRSEIKSLHQRLRTTTIHVTHDQVEAMTMADKIVVMSAGRVEQIGAPLDLYDRPANLFVAGFIGSPAMNILAGRLADGRLTTDGGLDLPVAGPAAGEVAVGIRPEDLTIRPDGALTGEIRIVEPMGGETQVHLKTGDGDMVALLRERFDVHPGDRVRLAFDPARMHLFDQVTGRRL